MGVPACPSITLKSLRLGSAFRDWLNSLSLAKLATFSTDKTCFDRKSSTCRSSPIALQSTQLLSNRVTTDRVVEGLKVLVTSFFRRSACAESLPKCSKVGLNHPRLVFFEIVLLTRQDVRKTLDEQSCLRTYKVSPAFSP